MSRKNNKTMLLLLFAPLAFLYMNCGSTSQSGNFSEELPGEDISNTPENPIDLTFCRDQMSTSFGDYCAVQPSTLDSLTKDVAGPTGQNLILGFGYHIAAVTRITKSRKACGFIFREVMVGPMTHKTNLLYLQHGSMRFLNKGI